MKPLVSLLGITALAGTLFAAPEWFRTLPAERSDYLIGYGQGDSCSAARESALREIAGMISITVSASYSNTVSLRDTALDRAVTSSVKTRSDAELLGHDVLEEAFVGETCYVAIGYENLAPAQRFRRAVRATGRQSPPHPYLSQTFMARKIGRGIGFGIDRHQGLWYLVDHSVRVPIMQNELGHLFANARWPRENGLILDTAPRRGTFAEGDAFGFDIGAPRTGFVSLLGVYEDGTVVVYFSNRPAEAGRTYRVPEDADIVASTLRDEETFDMYVLLFGTQRIDLSLFTSADAEVTRDERFKDFDALIDLMSRTAFITKRIVIKPTRRKK